MRTWALQEPAAAKTIWWASGNKNEKRGNKIASFKFEWIARCSPSCRSWPNRVRGDGGSMQAERRTWNQCQVDTIMTAAIWIEIKDTRPRITLLFCARKFTVLHDHGKQWDVQVVSVPRPRPIVSIYQDKVIQWGQQSSKRKNGKTTKQMYKCKSLH